MVNVAGIVEESMVDGVGVRYALFVQGCPHHCDGCHNKHTWSFNTNQLISEETIINQIKENPLLDGVTFSGGEPFMQIEPLIAIAKQVHEMGLTVWCYTGFLWEHIINDSEKYKLLQHLDVLVDGQFQLSLKNLALQFRGSSNQRIINVPQSINNGKIILAQI